MNAQWYLWATNAGVVVFTLALVANLGLMLIIGPRDRLEWSIAIKSLAYLAVMARACAMAFWGFPRDNLSGLVLFLLASAATAWFCYCAWADWLSRRRARGNGDDWNPR